MRVNLSARGPTVGAYLKIWPSLGAKFRDNPRFWKLLTTHIDGLYISCKFDVHMPKGCGDIAHWILAEKRKWNRLWEFPKVIIRHKFHRGSSSTTCVNLGPLRWYLIPWGPPEWFLKIPKFTPSLEPPPLAPVGASHWWLKIQLAPSSAHGVWKFQCASFKEARNIKGGLKTTKMEKNRVKKISYLPKS